MNPLASFIKRSLLLFIKLYYRIIPQNPIYFDPKQVRKVLVYAYFGTGLGNFVLYTPALRALKNFIPQANFTLLHANNSGCDQVLYGANFFEKYIIVRRNANWWRTINWIYKIREEKYDLIVSAFLSTQIFLVFSTIFSNAKYRLGHISSPGRKIDGDFIYNIPVKMKNNQHEIDRYLELIYALGIEEKDVDKKAFFHLGKKDREFADNFLKRNCIDRKKKNVISIQIGTPAATKRWKQWSLDKYRELSDRILEMPGTVIIFQGSHDEKRMIEDIADKMVHKPIIAAGKTSVKQAAALIEKSDILICNDSGLGKVSIALGTTTITIWGPSDYPRAKSWEDGHFDIRKELKCSPCLRLDGTEKVENCPYDQRCLKLISVDDVFQVVKKKLMRD